MIGEPAVQAYSLEGAQVSWRDATCSTVVALSLAVAACGCLSKEAVYRDVRASRATALARWDAGSTGRAGEPDAQPIEGKLTIDESVAIALTHNKMLRAAHQERGKARGKATEAWSNALPHLSLIAGYRRLEKVTSISVGDRSVTLGDEDNYSYGLSLKQPLFTGGATSAAIRAAGVYSCWADEHVHLSKQMVIFHARKAYCDSLLARVLLDVAKSAEQTAKAHLENVQIKRREGVASDFDVLRANVELSNLEALTIARKNELHLAQTRFLRALGVSQKSQVELVDKLEYTPVSLTLTEAVRQAFYKRPELLQAELDVRLQREALKIAKSGWWPKVFAIAEFQRAKPSPVDPTENHWEDQKSIGIGAEMPLFDGLRTYGKVKQARATLRQKEILLRDTEESVLLEVRQAVLSLADAEELVQSQKASLDRAQEGLRLAEVGYNNGINTQVEVLDARSALTRAQGLYHEAIYYHMLARLALEKATGQLVAPHPEATPMEATP